MPRTRKTKKSNLAPKKIPGMLPGQVEKRFVKCGKQRCKCSKGKLHGPYFYHRTWDGDKHEKRYIKLSEVKKTAIACANYRELQVQLRIGRQRYKLLMAMAREMFK
jgi:hypothetical protein